MVELQDLETLVTAPALLAASFRISVHELHGSEARGDSDVYFLYTQPPYARSLLFLAFGHPWPLK